MTEKSSHMKHVLVSLVGGRGLPVTSVALHLKPDIHYLIVSEDSSKKNGDCDKILAALPEALKPSETFIVEPYKPTDTLESCKKIFQKHPDDNITVNITSGPKTMAFGAYDVVKDSISEKVARDIGYLAGEDFFWLFRKNQTKIKIGLNDHFSSYGWNISTRQDDSDEKLQSITRIYSGNLEIATSLLRKIREDSQGKDKRTITIKKHILIDKEVELLRQIENTGIINNLDISTQKPRFTINSTKDGELLIGGNWLEYFTFRQAIQTQNKTKPLFEECGWNIKGHNNAHEELGEIDFAGTFGCQIIIASCKTEKELKRIWFEEIRARADQLGKGMCAPMLITSIQRKSRSKKDLEQYYKWQESTRVILVMAEDLSMLQDIFRKIKSSREDMQPKHILCIPWI